MQLSREQRPQRLFKCGLGLPLSKDSSSRCLMLLFNHFDSSFKIDLQPLGISQNVLHPLLYSHLKLSAFNQYKLNTVFSCSTQGQTLQNCSSHGPIGSTPHCRGSLQSPVIHNTLARRPQNESSFQNVCKSRKNPTKHVTTKQHDSLKKQHGKGHEVETYGGSIEEHLGCVSLC